jgi:8-oxo-dGTP pyrophosphatase MutT (NUDIX family)
MNFEPQKFFIGLVDFFSIMMPGAMLVYLGKDCVAMRFGLANGFPLDGAEAGVVFLFASYLLGHFAFLLSSALDDWVYDPLRGCTYWGQLSRRLAKGENLSADWWRRFAEWKLMFDTNADTAVIQAQRIKARAMHRLSAGDAINAFQWSKARLTKDLQEGLLAVQRFEADSKFFRSFVAVLGVLTVFYGLQCKWFAAGLCVAFMLPALWRYIDQRFKATQQAYWFVITLEAMKTDPPVAATRPDGLTLAGGVVYRPADKAVLLVEASRNRWERLLPKGHIEAGEEPRVAAVREVKEETGHWAKVVGWLVDAPLKENEPDSPMVRWFLMELAEECKRWRPEDRQRYWLPLQDALGEATYPETKAVLAEAKKRLDS